LPAVSRILMLRALSAGDQAHAPRLLPSCWQQAFVRSRASRPPRFAIH
jgi:hypothetical protein